MGMQRALLIRGGTVVNADRQERADVLCVDGVIAAVGAEAAAHAPAGAEVIDATGQFSVSEKGEQEAVASLGALSEALARRTGGDIARPVVISADKTIAYEKVMDAMRQLQKDGYTHIGLLVKTEQAALAVATVA